MWPPNIKSLFGTVTVVPEKVRPVTSIEEAFDVIISCITFVATPVAACAPPIDVLDTVVTPLTEVWDVNED